MSRDAEARGWIARRNARAACGCARLSAASSLIFEGRRAGVGSPGDSCENRGMDALRWPTYKTRSIGLDRPLESTTRGSAYVVDTEGRTYLDCVGGIGCAPLGHGDPRWVEAISTQLSKVAAAANSYQTAPQRAFAAALLERMPIAAAPSLEPRRPVRPKLGSCDGGGDHGRETAPVPAAELSPGFGAKASSGCDASCAKWSAASCWVASCLTTDPRTRLWIASSRSAASSCWLQFSPRS